MSDLIKEIEGSLSRMEGLARAVEVTGGDPEEIEKCCATLRRVRDALTWKPVDFGKLPHRKPFLFKIRDESWQTWDVRVDEVMDKEYYEEIIEPMYSHYVEIPPFNEGGPEEK